MKSSIARKFMLIYLIILVISFVLTSIIYSGFLRNVLQTDVSERLIEDSDAIKSFLSQSFNHDTEDESFSETSEFSEMLNDRVDRYLKYLKTTYLIINKFDRQVFLSHTNSSNKLIVEDAILPIVSENIKNNPETLQSTLITTYNDEQYSIVLTKITKDISTDLQGGWIIVYSPSGPLNEITSILFKALMISFPISLVIMFISSIFVSRSFSKPILELKMVAEEIATRNFDKRTKIKSNNEIGQLNNAINSMANSLKQYDIAQKNFLQNASHELKTPLMSIQGYAEGLSDGVFDNPDDAIKVIVNETNRLKNIVDSLIVLTKLETDSDTYTFDYYDIGEICNLAVKNIAGYAYSLGKEVVCNAQRGILIYCDRDKIIQSLINVLSNGIRHCDTIVSLDLTKSSSGDVKISISDDGNGISKNEEDKLFLRFYRGKNGNTGLGLSITKAIIDFHHGMISVTNNTPKGAIFNIYLRINPEI